MSVHEDGLVFSPEMLSHLPQNENLSLPAAHSTSHLGRSRGKTHDSVTSSRRTRPGPINVTDGTNWLIASVRHNRQGLARSEDVIDVLANVGVDNGEELLQALGLKPYGQVNVTDLLERLNDAPTQTGMPESVVVAAFICNQQELKHLKSLADEAMEESKRLKLDLLKANARNALLVMEEDERHIQLDKSWESRLLLVDHKYQEQIKELKLEMDNVRTTSAQEIAKLNVQLEESQTLSARERQQLVDKLASCQEEILRQEKALTESSKQLLLLSKQNESLAKELQQKLSESPGDYKWKLAQLEQALANTRQDKLKLKDFNDELVYELEKVQQKLLLEERKTQLVTNRLPTSSVEKFLAADNHFTNEDSNKPVILGNQQIMESVEYQNKSHPNLSKELSQSEIIEQRLKEIENKYKMAVDVLEEKHNSERRKMNDNIEQEKTSFAQEKFDLIQKCASEKNYMKHLHEQEIKLLQKRLQERESYIEKNTRMQNMIYNLETQLALCRLDVQNLDNQKSNFDTRLWQKEMSLRQDFEEERIKLKQQFSLKFEQQEIRHKDELDELFHKGAESLTGKLKVDFHQIVLENTEKEVRRSQATMLNQLHRDRGKLMTALEQEKLHIYEMTVSEQKTMVEKYEVQIATLQKELDLVYSQLEAEKRTLSEMSLRSVEESSASHKAVENLRKKMEEELLIELTRFKESFESEKKELASENVKLQDKLAELQRLLTIERKRAVEIDALKEKIKILIAEKGKMAKTSEEIKEKMYQQILVERADNEIQVKAAKDEGESQGRMEGLMQGREEGITQGGKEGYDKGFSDGRTQGQESGFIQGKEDTNSAALKSLEEMKQLVDSLKQEKTILDSELKLEKEKNYTIVQQLHDMSQLKASYGSLREEKNALENKHAEALAAIVDKHQAEKVNLLEEIHKLEAQSISLQSDMQAIEFHIGSVHQDLHTAREVFDQEVTVVMESDDANFSEEAGNLKEQIKQLSYYLKDTVTAQQELESLKKDYDALLLDKSELEQTVRTLTSDIEDNSKSRLQSAKVKDLNNEKLMFALLDQTSDQLDKVSTSMAFVQCKCVRELESMKQKAKSIAEVENYTKLQKRHLEHQGLVITLQDALRRREAIIDKVMKETEQQTGQKIQTKFTEIQYKLDLTNKELTKYKEKYKQMCAESKQQNLKMKDLYVENSDLIVTLAETEESKKHFEQQCRKLNVECETYRKEMDLVYENLSR